MFRIVSRADSGELFVALSNGTGELFFDARRLCVASLMKAGPDFKDSKTLMLWLHAAHAHPKTSSFKLEFASAGDAQEALKGLAAAVHRPSALTMSHNGSQFLATSSEHVKAVRIDDAARTVYFDMCDTDIGFYELTDEQLKSRRDDTNAIFGGRASRASKCESCDMAVGERGGGTTWTDPVLGERRLCYSCVADAALQFRASASATLRKQSKR